VAIAVFDAPASFRHPTTWHARAYGLSPQSFGRRAFTRDKSQDGSWTIPEGESITFRYRSSFTMRSAAGQTGGDVPRVLQHEGARHEPPLFP